MGCKFEDYYFKLECDRCGFDLFWLEIPENRRNDFKKKFKVLCEDCLNETSP